MDLKMRSPSGHGHEFMCQSCQSCLETWWEPFFSQVRGFPSAMVETNDVLQINVGTDFLLVTFWFNDMTCDGGCPNHAISSTSSLHTIYASDLNPGTLSLSIYIYTHTPIYIYIPILLCHNISYYIIVYYIKVYRIILYQIILYYIILYYIV